MAQSTNVLPTAAEIPERRLANSIGRLVRFIQLDAPASIVEKEINVMTGCVASLPADAVIQVTVSVVEIVKPKE